MWLRRVRSFLGGGLRPGIFAAIVVVGALCLFSLPYPSGGQVRRLLLLKHTRATISIAGPSTIDYVSPCDHDRRTVPMMLGDLSLTGVADLSVVGQPVADSLNVSAMTAHATSIRDVVLPLSYTGLDDWGAPPYRKLISYKMLTPAYATFAVSGLHDLWGGLTDQPTRGQSAFTYDGRRYPDYRGIAAGEFAKEKAASACPEPETHNSQFLHDYVWWTHIQAQPNPAFPGLVRDLQQILSAKRKRLLVVMLPINLDLIGAISQDWRRTVEARSAVQVAKLRATGAEVLDLTKEFPQKEFSTQWCACIHLNQAGRYHLADAIATRLGPPNLPPNDNGSGHWARFDTLGPQ